MKKSIAFCCAVMLICSIGLYPAFSLAEKESVTAPIYDAGSIDLDLLDMSGTMVYAQIYQMAIHPEEYMGKIVRLSGWFDSFTDSSTNIVYTVCYIPDASACCAQGIEFVWMGNHDFAMDCPEAGTEIVVTGRFETYFEGEWEYMRLADAELIWSKE